MIPNLVKIVANVVIVITGIVLALIAALSFYKIKSLFKLDKTIMFLCCVSGVILMPFVIMTSFAIINAYTNDFMDSALPFVYLGSILSGMVFIMFMPVRDVYKASALLFYVPVYAVGLVVYVLFLSGIREGVI